MTDNFFFFFFFFFFRDVEKFEGTFGSSKKPHPEVCQWPHMVTVFSGAGRPMLLTVLWSRATTQPCGGTFFEACLTELDPFPSLVMRTVSPELVLYFGNF